MVVIPTSNDWVTLTPTCCFWVSTTTTLTLLVELCWCEIDNVPVYDYPLVSIVVQYVGVNTPLIFYSWFK
jgi:hypothetical protein